VVKLVEPAAMVDEFVVPASTGKDSLLPALLFEKFLSQAPRMGTDKGPMA